MDEQTRQMREMIRNTFNAVADGYGAGASRFFHDSSQLMAELHQLQGNERILDVACGTGAAAIPLAKCVPNGRVTGIDLSPGMLAQARQRAQAEGLANIEFQEQDMTALSVPDGSFDRVNCGFGLFFVEDMLSLLKHLGNKLRPGGKVMVSGFTGNSFMPAAKTTLELLSDFGVEVPEQPLGWKRMAEPEQLHALFADAGLTDVSIERRSLGYYVDKDGWWQVVWNAGFRGLVARTGDRLEEYRTALFDALEPLVEDKGIWMDVDVNYTTGTRP